MSQIDLQTLILKAADDELTAEEARLLETCAAESCSHFNVEQAISFERRLRVAVARCMSEQGGACPVDLPEQIRTTMDRDGASESRSVVAVWHRWLPSGLAAGIIVLIAAALAIGLLGRGWEISSFWSDDKIEFVPRDSWTVTTTAGAVSELRDMSGRADAEIPDLSEYGCVFAGANRLILDDGRSVLQIGYSGSGSFVMIWIQGADSLKADFYDRPFSAGQAYRIISLDGTTKDGPNGDPLAGTLAWVSDGLVYFISARNGSSPAPAAERTVALALGMPGDQVFSVSRTVADTDH